MRAGTGSSVRLALAALCCLRAGRGQECPKDNAGGPPTASAVRELSGRLVFHDDLRQWFELEFNAPVCGEKSVELVTREKGWSALQVLRGCRVRSAGYIVIPGTGYYSASLYQYVNRIEPEGACERQQPFPDYSRWRPATAVRRYHVVMKLHYQTDGPLKVDVTSAGHHLAPWQVYASYVLTGGFVFYGYCGKGFIAENPGGAPEGKPYMDDGFVAFDPESVPKGVDPIRLEYDCRRLRRGETP